MAAIVVENVSKKYRLVRSGDERLPYRTLRDELVRWASWPVRYLRGQTSRSEDFWALKDVSFEVQPGEVVGIIGRNGAGKSTLLKVLSRITKPTSGRVRLRGRVGSLLEVGTGFHPELTGRENIYLSGAVLGMRRAEIRRKFDEMVAFAEVEKFLETPVKRYSSGMYTRLAFAVAAHLEPEILLVDEVLAVGDAAFQKKCLGKMNEVAKGGRTVLFVSHNMNAVEELCGRVVLLRSGKLVRDGEDVRGVLHEYLGGDAGEARAEWVNPGAELENPWFKPLRLSVTGLDGRPVGQSVRNDAALSVVVEGRIDVPDPAMNVGYAVSATSGELLYWSLTTDGAETDWPKAGRGPVRFSSPLPTRLLNEGDYRVELIVSLHCRSWISQPGVNAPTVVFTIQGGLSDSPYWMHRRPGLLAPVLPWASIGG